MTPEDLEQIRQIVREELAAAQAHPVIINHHHAPKTDAADFAREVQRQVQHFTAGTLAWRRR